MLALVALSFASCEKETEGVTGITIYPVLELDGETTLYLEKGSTFEDPGYTATLDGEDVTDQVVIDSNVNMNASGFYSISYKITNKDGFSASDSRKVIVLDPNDDIDGFYTVTANSYRFYKDATVEYGDEYEIIVAHDNDKLYFSDALAGWYAQRANYGDAYEMFATIGIDSDNNLSLISSLIPGWGDGLVGFSGSWDSTNKTFTYVAKYVSGMTFYVTLTKE